MDLVILDIDIENSAIILLHNTHSTLEHAKRELKCIGFQMVSVQIQNGQKPDKGTRKV